MKFTELFPLNRVVVLVTPLFATLSGLISAWLADHLPFIADQVTADDLKLIFLGGVAAALAPAYKWLDNLALFDAREASGELDTAVDETGHPPA